MAVPHLCRRARPLNRVLTRALWCGPALLSVVVLTGCDAQVQRQAEASEAFDRAETLIERASLGMPEDAAVDDRAWRAEQLEAAAAELETAASTGSPGLAANARKLLATVRAGQIDRRLELAAASAAELGVQGLTLLSGVGRLTTLDARAGIAGLKPDEALALLNEREQALAQQSQQLQSEAEALRTELEPLREEVTEQEEAASVALRTRFALENEAASLSGDARFDLLRQATQAKRAADAASVRVDRLQSTINTKQAELEVLEQQVRSQEAARETLQRQAEALQNSAAASAGVLAEVEQERQATREALVAQLNGLLDRFEQEVRQPLTEAESAARASLQLLETLPQQDAGVPTLVQRAQLSKIMTRLALHSQRFKATAGAIAEALDAPEATQRVAAIDAAAANDLARTSIAETLAEVERVESDGGARIADPIGQSMERLRLQLLGEG